MMLQEDSPDDYVIGTGEAHTVRELCELAFSEAGIELEWRGSGTEEVGIVAGCNDKSTLAAASCPLPAEGTTVVAIDPRYFRPTEVEFLLADSAKAKEKLGWESKVTFEELVRIMIAAEIEPLGELEQSRDIIRKIMNNKAGKR